MTHHYNSNITPHGFSYCRGGVLTDPVPEPDLWFSHIRLFDDSCPDRARPCSLGFLCWGFKPPSKGPRCVPRPCSQSHLIKRHRPSKTCRSGRPSPSRWSLLFQRYFRYYFGLRLPVPPVGEGWAVGIALLLCANHRTRQGLTGSVQNLSERAIPNHSTGLAGVFTHSALRFRGNPKPLRQRTSPPTEGWSSLLYISENR